ncbi:ankyrin repeat-containing protein BDA1-like [Rhododendron vialii]|uniref:ankyrin repeat-containing protein BDA1-like n=1 Tax=Rhododendron vialii TaxID=182163 RepID=UPI00266017C6|nr:ankyrin repeat-containing protein BDA1-like [Rhododendron vialii]
MKGRVEVILELLRDEPESIHEKLAKGETVLHLCVKCNRLEAFKTLVQYLHNNHMEFLLTAGDDDGNTILHLVAALKQKNNIEYLMEIRSVKDHANVKNKNGFTALDVMEHCPNRDLKAMEIREFLLQVGVRRFVCSEQEPTLNHLPIILLLNVVVFLGFGISISRSTMNSSKSQLRETRAHAHQYTPAP